MKNIKIISSVYLSRLGKDISLPVLNQTFQMIGSLCYFYLHLLAFKLIINRFTFSGWTKSELMILLMIFEVFTYLAFFIFWKGFNETVKAISTGAFDSILSKPASSLVITFFRGGGQHNLYCTILGIIYLIYYFISGNFNFSLIYSVLFLFTLLTSLWVLYCFSITLISLNFHFGYLPATSTVMYQIQEVYKYPATAFTSLVLIVFSLFTTIPTMLLLQKPISPYLILIYILTLIVSTLLAHFSWRSGLRHYSSAN